MTYFLVFLLSAVCYIVLSFVTYVFANWVAKKYQYELKRAEAGIIQCLGLGFVIGLIFSSLTAGHRGCWGPAIVFTGCFFGFGLLMGLLCELE